MTTQTAEHRRKRSAAMRGKNTGPQTRHHRAFISASRKVGWNSPDWLKHYWAKWEELDLIENLSKSR